MNQAEWKLWRHKGIGGSDAPIILGKSPYKTALELYEEKIMPEPPEEKSNFVADRGNRFEPKIRSLISLTMDIDFEVALVELPGTPLKVSLDGRSPDRKIIIEIKTVGKDDHELAKQKIMPEKYIAQVQHELFVTKADVCLYCSYYDKDWNEDNVSAENLEIFEVKPDLEYQSDLISKEYEFWEAVQKRKPPLLSDADFKPLKGVSKIANQFKRAQLKYEKVSAELDAAREALIEAAKKDGHPRLSANGIPLVQVSKQGSIDYKKVPNLAGVDLVQYRQSGSTYWKVG